MNKVIHRDWGEGFVQISLDLSAYFFDFPPRFLPVRWKRTGVRFRSMRKNHIRIAGLRLPAHLEYEAYTPQDARVRLTGWS